MFFFVVFCVYVLLLLCLVNWGEMIQIPLKVGHHRMAFRWRADDGAILKAGSVAL